MFSFFNATFNDNLNKSLSGYIKDVKCDLIIRELTFLEIYFSSELKIDQIFLILKNKKIPMKGVVEFIGLNRFVFKFDSYFDAFNIHKKLFLSLPLDDQMHLILNSSRSIYKYAHLLDQTNKEKINKFIAIEQLHQKSRKYVMIGKTKEVSQIRSKLIDLISCSKPILIFGKQFHGRTLLANIIVHERHHNNDSFIYIDLKKDTFNGDKHYPLNKTLVFSHFECLSKQDYFVFFNQFVNNKIICISTSNHSIPFFLHSIEIPNISKRRGDLKLLFNYNLSQYNKKSLFIEKKIYELIEKFDWENILQMKNFCKNLILNYEEILLKETDVKLQLDQLKSTELNANIIIDTNENCDRDGYENTEKKIA